MHAYTAEPKQPAVLPRPSVRRVRQPWPLRPEAPIPVERLVNARESRKERLTRLRRDVRRGTYQPDLHDLAGKLLETGLF